MTQESLAYNTQRADLRYSEYGRNVQNMVAYLKTIEDREKRTRLAHAVVGVMANLNPGIKEVGDYKQKLWDHLFAIAGFDLDVESPFPPPEPAILAKKPDALPYPTNHIRFRFYGRNVQNMILHAVEMEEGDTRTAFINLIASFMRNSCKNWNNENLAEEAIVEHMKILSGGKLNLTPEEITILFHTREYTRPMGPRQNQGNNKNFNKGNRNQGGGGRNQQNRRFRKK